MNTLRDLAIAYCHSIDARPHEHVWGYIDGVRFAMVRWQWYVGARAGQ